VSFPLLHAIRRCVQPWPHNTLVKPAKGNQRTPILVAFIDD
jgi:hypothetical protein